MRQNKIIWLISWFCLFGVTQVDAQGVISSPQKNNKSKKQSQKIQQKSTRSNHNDMVTGHEYVDLGLPSGTRWATCNVGASSPQDNGNYYAWGDITLKEMYDEKSSQTSGEDKNQLFAKGIINIVDNLHSKSDVAYVQWKYPWRTPTKADFAELLKYCTWSWDKQMDKDGYKITGPNGRSIFLPAAGYTDGKKLIMNGINGYWSSTISEGRYKAFSLDFTNGEKYIYDNYRYIGLSVRPVTN
ncbi:MAG: hypothetical protein HDR87_07075 [Bacteroides sp.]|nr:hypothetical protein [Bacteroides sp.]